MNFCTIADKNYTVKGLAMFQSLTLTVQGAFTLHWLCLDKESFSELKQLQQQDSVFGRTFKYRVKLYSLYNLEEKDSALLAARKNPSGEYGTQYSQWCWCLTPYFTNYILQSIPQNEYLMYVDSDIYFYKNPVTICNIMNGKSVGIHTHRFLGIYNDDSATGWYNVGVVVFANNDVGKAVAKFWKQCMLDVTNIYYEKYGTCGDQKYLNLFPKLWGGHVSIFDEEGSEERCGHLAPWNRDGLMHPARHVVVNGRGIHEPVVFFHFSHFTLDSTGNEWKDSINGEWNPSRDIHIKKYYEEYFNVIQHINDIL